MDVCHSFEVCNQTVWTDFLMSLFFPIVEHFKKTPKGLFKTAIVMNELHSKETKVCWKKTKMNLEKHGYVFKKNTGLLENAFACVHAHTLSLVHLPVFSAEHTSFKTNGVAFSLRGFKEMKSICRSWKLKSRSWKSGSMPHI